MKDIIARLRALDPVAFDGIVRRILDDNTATLESWRCDPIAVPVTSGFTAGIVRLSGTAHATGDKRHWSAVLKLIRRPEGTTAYDDSGGDLYWRREACVYESDLLDDLPGGLAAPRCYAALPQSDHAVLLWLEEVEDRHSGHWPLEWFDTAARHLGRFNGAYLAGGPLPVAPWLPASPPLRAWASAQAESAALAARSEIWRHLLLRRAFPRPVADRLLRLWAERETFVVALTRLPQTLCHFDAGHHNLLPQPADGGHARTVAIDWEKVATAAVGEEIGLLPSTPFIRGATLDPAEAAPLCERVFESYLAGLRDTGWRGDTRDVRLGFTANAALRSVFMAPSLKAIADESRQAREERRWGRPFPELLAARAALTYALLDLADEARDLLADRPA